MTPLRKQTGGAIAVLVWASAPRSKLKPGDVIIFGDTTYASPTTVAATGPISPSQILGKVIP